MGRGGACQFGCGADEVVGGGITTEGHPETWDFSEIAGDTWNEWHHVAMVYDGSTVNFYFDGETQGGGTADSANIVVR